MGKSVCGPRYRLLESVRSTHSQDGAIVLDVRKGLIYKLNLVGSRVLELLKCKSELLEASITDQISNEFGISPEVAAQDLQEFLRILVRHQLVERLTSEIAL